MPLFSFLQNIYALPFLRNCCKKSEITSHLLVTRRVRVFWLVTKLKKCGVKLFMKSYIFYLHSVSRDFFIVLCYLVQKILIIQFLIKKNHRNLICHYLWLNTPHCLRYLVLVRSWGLPYFSRLEAKFSEMITKFWGCSLKIQHWSSFDLNGLERPKWEFKRNVMG